MPVHVRSVYASYGQSLYVATFHESSTNLNRFTTPENEGSRHNPQHADWPIRGFVASFSPTTASEAVGKSQFCQWQATRLTGPISPACDQYVQYLLVGANHRSLTNTGEGYNLGYASVSHTTTRPSQPVVSPFHLRAPPGLRLSIINISLLQF
jgi:hypothetical protein